MKYIVVTDNPEALNKAIPNCGCPQSLNNIIIVDTELSIAQIKSIDGVQEMYEDGIDEPTTIPHNLPNNPSWYVSSLSYPTEVPSRSGEGVSIYIMDSGMRTSHVEFNGRAETVYSFDDREYGGAIRAPDHGTQCGSCAGGVKYGIAKKANIFSARYNWSHSEGLKALDTILKHYREHPYPSILSMSFSSPTEGYYKYALDMMMKEGIVCVAAASNNREPFTRYPAGNEGVLSVGAVDNRFRLASFTNYGKNVDVYASGVNGIAANTSSNYSSGSYSGTSAATPLVAGCLALMLEGQPKLRDRKDVDDLLEQFLNQCHKDLLNISKEQALANTINLFATANAKAFQRSVEASTEPPKNDKGGRNGSFKRDDENLLEAILKAPRRFIWNKLF